MTTQPAPPDLRLGRWQDVLEGEECDALIFDAPFGERTHSGHNGCMGRKLYSNPEKPDVVGSSRRQLDYGHLTEVDVIAAVEHWHPRTSGWICSITDHTLGAIWHRELERVGRLCFPPLPVIDRGSRVRLTGDGPSGWCVWMIVARPRTAKMAKWGTLPGLYERSQGDERSKRMGGKPLGVMRAIVRDYSRPGDIVCDPFAGHGTTLLAALTEGRRALGSEVDPEAHEAACARLAMGYTLDMFAGLPPALSVGQP